MARLIGHLLLALCLVLNGIGATALAAGSSTMHGATPPQADSLAASRDGSCHDMVAAADHQPDAGTPVSTPPAPDCCDPQQPCDPALCDGLCAQHAAAMAVIVSAAGSEDLGHHYRAVPLPGREDPALRRPVRPPIA